MIEFKKVFLDTAPLIYYLEKNPRYSEYVKAFLRFCYEKKVEIITSSITVEEYCVYPYRIGNKNLIKNFYSFLEDMGIEIISINRQIAEKAAQIRAKYKDFKAMDALQLAVASMQGCDLFLTNDRQLRQFDELICMLADDLQKGTGGDISRV